MRSTMPTIPDVSLPGSSRGIDFIVKGIDSKTRSVVANRKEAMLRKRQTFYLDTDAAGMYRIYEGRIAQACVIAVAEKVIRVEVFGVECSIMARNLAWEWIGDAHERFSVGDQVLVRILNVRRDSLEDMDIKTDIKCVSQNTNHDNLKKMPHPEQVCRQGHRRT